MRKFVPAAPRDHDTCERLGWGELDRLAEDLGLAVEERRAHLLDQELRRGSSWLRPPRAQVAADGERALHAVAPPRPSDSQKPFSEGAVSRRTTAMSSAGARTIHARSRQPIAANS